jgi:hypothetical protein
LKRLKFLVDRGVRVGGSGAARMARKVKHGEQIIRFLREAEENEGAVAQ